MFEQFRNSKKKHQFQVFSFYNINIVGSVCWSCYQCECDGMSHRARQKTAINTY